MQKLRGAVLDYVGFGTMQLRFIIFHKIISLRSVFAPVEFSLKTLTSPINYFALLGSWVASSSKAPHGLRIFYRLGHLPSFYSGIFPTAVINYFALYSEAGSLPRLKLRTAYAFLLTIRRSQRRIRSLLYKTKTKNMKKKDINELQRKK